MRPQYLRSQTVYSNKLVQVGIGMPLHPFPKGAGIAELLQCSAPPRLCIPVSCRSQYTNQFQV
jgi:hypothetical protein